MSIFYLFFCNMLYYQPKTEKLLRIFPQKGGKLKKFVYGRILILVKERLICLLANIEEISEFEASKQMGFTRDPMTSNILSVYFFHRFIFRCELKMREFQPFNDLSVSHKFTRRLSNRHFHIQFNNLSSFIYPFFSFYFYM